MYTSILKATRAHYAALKHRASPDRIPLHYTVETESETGISILTRGTIYVKGDTKSKRKRELTKLLNRLQNLSPEASHIEVTYK